MHATPPDEGGGEGGRGFWTQNLVYQKWPDQIFPAVNFVFSHYGHFGLGRRGGGGFGGAPPPLAFNYSKETLGGGGVRCDSLPYRSKSWERGCGECPNKPTYRAQNDNLATYTVSHVSSGNAFLACPPPVN